MRRLTTLFRFLCCVLILVGSLVPEPGQASLESEMAEKNQRLLEQKKNISALETREKVLTKDVGKLENAIKDAEATLQQLEKELAALKKEQAAGAQALSAMLAEREKTVQRLSELMRTLWPVYLTAREQGAPEQWADANRREEWLASLYGEAESLRDIIERQSQALADQQAETDRNAEKVTAQVAKIAASKADLEKKKTQFARQIKDVKTQKAQSEKEIQSLLGAITSLRHQISLQAQQQISKQRGKLPWPAKGRTVAVFAPGGNPACNGLGLALAAGTPVRSVSWGKVVHNDQLRGFGQVVVIFHGEDYYSLYAFLSDAPLAVGQNVDRGQQIGVSGFYPVAKGNGLYFELRHKQQAENPLSWLESG